MAYKKTIQEKNGQRNIVNEAQFRAWQGSDNLDFETTEELLLDVVNGIYSIEDLIHDIKSYE